MDKLRLLELIQDDIEDQGKADIDYILKYLCSPESLPEVERDCQSAYNDHKEMTQ